MACERSYDTWVRRYASDLIAPVLVGMVIVAGVGLGLPVLGYSFLYATAGIFAGAGALVGLHRLNQRRRRQQFLTEPLPRAYLPEGK
ncbi:MAG: hypothetical protein AB7O24_14305 [Kofleriaceae bacterium]